MATPKLANKVAASTESEMFDLGGSVESQMAAFVAQAFGEPLSLPSDVPMIRLSFVIGAGKLDRGKYDASLGKWFTAALVGTGFKNDSSASCVADSAGCFKFQHDTGKNLKLVHVFPNVKSTPGGVGVLVLSSVNELWLTTPPRSSVHSFR